jgi:hypothetical protein
LAWSNGNVSLILKNWRPGGKSYYI